MAYLKFQNQEIKFLDWQQKNPQGFILNIPNPLKRSDGKYHPIEPRVRVHVANCPALKTARGEYTTTTFYKICSVHLPDLQIYCSEVIEYENGSKVDWTKALCLKCEPTQLATNQGNSAEPTPSRKTVGNSDFESALRRTILTMVVNAESAVAASGKQMKSVAKDKKLFHSRQELEVILRRLFEEQNRLCAITGLTLQLNGLEDDSAMLASLDRVDSDGHYQDGNLQLVCRFVNFWKSATPNNEFLRLLNIVKGLDDRASGQTIS